MDSEKTLYFGKRGMTKSLSKGTVIMIVLLKPVHRVNDPYPLSVVIDPSNLLIYDI